MIQSDIVDINDIFKDLGMMIHEQGDMIGEVVPALLAPELFAKPPLTDKRRLTEGKKCPSEAVPKRNSISSSLPFRKMFLLG